MKIIFDIFDIIWRFIVDVFIEESSIVPSREILSIHNATEHYRGEFPGFLLDQVFIGTQYGKIREALESYKYHSERAYRDIFVDLYVDIVSEMNLIQGEVVLTTVPMHWSRYGIRGFDHMDYITKGLSKKINVEYIQYLNSRFSYRQSHLSRKKRFENRKNHFTMKNPREKLPRTIILIDDVISTGATANECARVYKEIFPECRVIGIFLASNT